MRIAKIVAYKLEIPMHSADITSFGTIDRKPTVVVEVETDDGIKGWGEAAALSLPVYNAETVDTCMLTYKKLPCSFSSRAAYRIYCRCYRKASAYQGTSYSQSGLGNSFVDDLFPYRGKIFEHFTWGSRKKIAVGESIGIKASIDELREKKLAFAYFKDSKE